MADPTMRPTGAKQHTRRHRTPALLAVAVILVGLSDATREVGIQSGLTVLLLGALCLALPGALYFGPLRVTGRVMPPLALVLFLALAFGSFVTRLDSDRAAQNFILYAIFILGIPVAAARATPDVAVKVLKGFVWASVVLGIVYMLGVAKYGPNTDLGLVPSRATAGALIPGIAATVPLITMIKTGKWRFVVIWVALVMTLSRAQMAEGLILTMGLAVHATRPFRTILRLMFAAAAGVAAAIYAYENFAPLRERFQQGDGYTIGNFTVGSSGRNVLWSLAWEHGKLRPWEGWGVGSSEEWINRFLPTQTHPHNDYLRLFHDFGIPGVALFVVGMLILFAGCVRRFLKSTDRRLKAVHLAAVLGMVYLFGDMIFNNPVTAVFIMYPLAVLIGLSRGLGTSPTVDPSAPSPIVSHEPDAQPSARVPARA